jgi:lipopolysaccharide/colanic/teichoic acid biosynthesis glycosyltransferase
VQPTAVPYKEGSRPPVPCIEGTRVRSATTDNAARFCAKRAMDVVMTTGILLLLLPLLLTIAALIKLDSPGRVLFVQDRVGARRRSYKGKAVWEQMNFRCYKFRSMAQNADQAAHQAYIRKFMEERLDTSRPVKLTGDPRVTRIGRILRRTSLDELPQLFNVLKGDMSLVGPRPVPMYEAAAYQDWHRERLAALPGITGLWQVEGRGRVSFTTMIQMDIEYVRNQSLLLDIRLLLFTIPAVLTGRGAE